MIMKKWLYFGILFKAIDVTTTYYMISVSDHTMEANPFVEWTIKSCGNFAAMIMNMLVFVVLMLTAYKLKAKNPIYIGTVIVACVALWNAIGLILSLTP
jgi:hypothetical protein